MLRSLILLGSLSLSTAARAAPDCTIPPLPQSDKSPQAAAAAAALRATKPCTAAPGVSVKSLKTVWASLLSNKKLGGRRLDTETPPGLPNGLALSQQGKIGFDFGAVAAEGISSFRLEADGKVLLNTATPAQQLSVPVGAATSQTSFSWQLVTRSASYHGQFTLIDAAARADVEQQLAQLEKEEMDPVSRLIYQAAIYDEADLYSERERVFATLRRQLGL